MTVAALAGVPTAITLAGSDADGDALGFAIASPPTVGTLGGSAPSVLYTAPAGFSGSDSFTFRASDGEDESEPARVELLVVSQPNAAPVFHGEPYAFDVPPGAPPGTVPGSLAASDADDDALAYAITAGDADGTFAIDAGGILTLADAAGLGAAGTTHLLTVKVSDGRGGSATTTVDIAVRGPGRFADGFED